MNYAKIEVARQRRTVDVVLTGEFDLNTASMLVRDIEQRLEEGARVFRIDLRNVSFLDSAGVKALLCCLRSVRVRGGRLLLTRPSSPVRKVFAALGFECFLLPAA
ncbi:MAG: STAS domain-containing protein [Candidatus Eremiobacteraeota bacterium]|nr:STAS domain-containing protein [Candidatus Eremiobacteraeota bacterium]MCW5868851.1 STAS domain-containing protein [Candidatus Eremiobacteraeota bacterium]